MNLLSKLHKNSILTGPVESYCLACGCLLCSEEDSYAHIHESKHVKKLESLPQLNNYKEDCIIKIKEGYFCPYCNIVLPTIKRVSLHVAEAKHVDNKYSQSITRHIGAILAFNEVVIADKAWHGLDGSTCFVCNEDYDDEEHHKTEATHVLSLIQNKCELGDKFVYRKVDEDLFFCLICNDILPISDKPSHHESVTHLDLYEKSKKEATEIRNKNSPVNELNNNKVEPAGENIHTIKDTGDGDKIQDDNVHNRKTHIIENNNCGTQKDTIQSTVLDTENVQNSENGLTNKCQNKNVIETILKEKSAKDKTKKAQEVKIDAQNKKTQENKPNIDKVQTEDKPIEKPKKAENLSKAGSKKSEIPKESSKTRKPKETKNTEPNKVKLASDDIDSYLYKHLKSHNFLIKTSKTSYCSLCDITLEDHKTIAHNQDYHHKAIYAKHMKRINARQLVNGINEPSDTNGKLNIESTKTNDDQIKSTSVETKEIKPASVQAANIEAKATSVETKEIKPASVQAAKIEAKVNTQKKKANEPKAKQTTEIEPHKLINKKSEQKEIDEINSKNVKVDKENTAPVNKTSETRNYSVDRQDNVFSVKADVMLSRKAIKKAQKKAAKAKLAETRAQEREKLQIPLETEASSKEDNLEKEDINQQNAQENVGALVVEQNKEQNKDIITTDSKINGAMAYPCDTSLKTERLANILKTASQIDSSPKDVVINGKYVLENLSFVLIMKTGGKTECVACDSPLTTDGVPRHISTDEHRTNMEDCLVVTSLDDEFIRQGKSQAYHCGFCNVLLSSTSELHSHLQSYCHGDAKTSAAWRLQRYQPGLTHPPVREVREILTAIVRCTR